VIDFHDYNGSLLNEFLALDGEDAVGFAVAHGAEETVARAALDNLEDDDDLGASALDATMTRTPGEIHAAIAEASDRAWANRAAVHSSEVSAGPWVELMLKYPDLHEPQHHGPVAGAYYTGVLSALRWALGDGWNGDT
jgi:hypothetical protein